MSDKPITFSGAMVRALLAGTKTQTRRVMNPQPYPNGFKFDAELGDILCHNDYLPPATLLMDKGSGENRYTISDVEDGVEAFSRIKVGDRLYVREHWRTSALYDETAPRDLKQGAFLHFIADGEEDQRTGVGRNSGHTFGRFRQAMHMPKWASRITLHVTEVRVQRLHDLSEADALAEGCVISAPVEDIPPGPNPQASYMRLWDKINGEGSAEKNPWVTATSFEVERCHIDQARAG